MMVDRSPVMYYGATLQNDNQNLIITSGTIQILNTSIHADAAKVPMIGTPNPRDSPKTGPHHDELMVRVNPETQIPNPAHIP